MIIIYKDVVVAVDKDIIVETVLGKSFQFPDLPMLREKELEVM